MPLPKTNPALNPALQEGLHPDDIARMELRQKKTNEMIANLNDRLADIGSFAQSFQQGIYSSFGNNFITRAAVGMPQMMGDILDSFLLTEEDKKKKKDPIGSALEDILEELNTIDEHLMKSFGSTIKDAFDESFKKMDKKGESSDCCEKSLDVLNKILDTINKAFGETQQKEEPVVDLKENAQIVPYKDFKASDFTKNDRMNSFEPTEVFEVNPNRIGYSAPEKKDTLSSRVTNDSFIDVEPKPVVNRAVDVMLGTGGDKPINVNIVGAAIDRLNEMDREMEKMVSIIPLSTAEQDLESKEKNIVKPVKEDIKDVSNKKEIKEEKKEESPNKSEEPKKQSSILGSVMDTLGGIAETYGLTKGAKAVLGKGGSLLGKIPKGIAGAAAVTYGAANIADYGFGTLGFGKDSTGEDLKIDEAKDDANWNKMSFGEKIQSGFARGIEYVGSAVGFGNVAKEAEFERIKDETEYLNKKRINFSPDPALDKASMFERKTEELDASKSVNKTSDNSTQNNSVINNIKNTNIHPSRQGSKNTEPSYNRYLDTTFYFQGR